MFEFDNGYLFVLTTKDVVTVLRTLANAELDKKNAKFVTVEVTNAAGVFEGAGFMSKGHPVVVYSTDLPSTQPTTESKDAKSEEDSSTTQG